MYGLQGASRMSTVMGQELLSESLIEVGTS
jgi:hypothetical protein